MEGIALKEADIINPGLLSMKMLSPVVNDSVRCDHFYEMTQITLFLFPALFKSVINCNSKSFKIHIFEGESLTVISQLDSEANL